MEMNLLTIKEYAKKKNVSYEAVRKQIQKYKDNELKEHIIKKNKTQYLDEYAVDFLDNRRRESPIMLIQMDKDEEIERLKAEKEALLLELASVNKKLNEVRDKLDDSRERVHELEIENTKLLEVSRREDEIAMDSDKKPWWKFW